MILDLTDEETDALAGLLRRTIDDDRYLLSPRIQTLKAVLAKLPEPRPRALATNAPAANTIISLLCPASPRNRSKTDETRTEQRERCRLGHRGRKFGDDDLAIAAPEVGHQDLIDPRIEGAAAAARGGPAATSTTAKAAASTSTWISRAPSAATKAPVSAVDVEGGDAAGAASSKIWEGAAAPSLAEGTKWTDAITAGAEEATTPATPAEAPERTATSSAVTALPAVTGAASAAASETASGAAALAGTTSATSAASATTAATTSDNKRHVIGADHEGATAPTTASHTGAADGDLESFPGGQAKIAANLGGLTACAARKAAVSTLRAKREDLISVGGRHREGDEAAGISEVERCSAGRRP
jgi:hypothetical protein